MPDSRLTIHESSFVSRPCDNYTCRQAANKRKYFVGNPGGFGHKPIFCEDCINYLIENLPAEFVNVGANLEAKLREEITAEYEEILKVKVFEAVQADRQSIKDHLHEEANRIELETTLNADPNYMVQEEKTVTAEANVEEDKDPVYRCLDCGQEFDTPQKLGAHKRKHRDD